MPVGPITPGVSTTITPDADPAAYASIQGPSPTMDVVAQDILDLSLVVLNVQRYGRRPELDASKEYLLAAQDIFVVQDLPWEPITTAGVGGWYGNDTLGTFGGAGPSGAVQFDVSGEFAVTKKLRLPHGCLLEQIEVLMIGAGAHVALPGTPAGDGLPFLLVNKKDLTTGIVSTLVTASDPSATTGQYQVIHPITTGSIGEVIDRTAFEYNVDVIGEQDANALPGLIAVAVTAKIRVFNIYKAGS